MSKLLTWIGVALVAVGAVLIAMALITNDPATNYIEHGNLYFAGIVLNLCGMIALGASRLAR